jgi:hypothetical protein
VFPASRAAVSPDPRTLERAAQLLRASQLVVEVDWILGCMPSVQTQEGIRQFLDRYAKPRDGVRLVLDEEIFELSPGVPIPVSRTLSDPQILELVRRHRNLALESGAQSIYLLFIPRHTPDGTGHGERGEAWGAQSFAVVAVDQVRAAGILTIDGYEVERFVTQHELGHLLGLVSNESHEHAAHCTNPACIMYAQPDLRAVVANWWRVFSGRLPTELDADCERDLEQLRESARRGSATPS